MTKAKRPRRSVATQTALPSAVTQHPQCAQCLPAKCCRYFSLEVDTPVDKRDYDDLLWMLAHQQVSVYVDDGAWYLMVHTQCNFLDTDTNLCKIYDTRPEMCREHSVDDCEWHGPYGFEHHFKSYDEFMAYLVENGLWE